MQKVMASLLLSVSLLVSGIGASTAAEQVRKDEQPSFLERYTNAAQDVILQGLKLVGVRYRLGGIMKTRGWIAAASSASYSRTASVPRCRVPPRK